MFKEMPFITTVFSEPPKALSDPTEKSHFSNLAGKAIADFLSKRIDNSLFTLNYEAVMRIKGIKLIGKRPDLFAFSQKAMFSLEAKGRSQSNPGNMAVHKAQAQAGPIPVHFSIACISYNLFNRVTCNYHDPFDENVLYDNDSLQELTRKYYKGLLEYLNQKWFEYREVEFQGERFYEVEFSIRNFENLLRDEFPFQPIWYFELLEFYRPRLILPAAINQYAETGITNDTNPFLFEYNSQDEDIYIDNDRVGLRIVRT
jgi:hypothetical protein